MVCSQNVKYNSPNRMYISHKNLGDDTPDILLLSVFYTRHKKLSVYSTITASDLLKLNC